MRKDIVLRREANARYIAEQKDKPCADCGGTFPAICMDWHHEDEDLKDEKLKKRNSGSMVRRMRCWSKERIDNELSKCAVLCANCHRIRHDK